MVYWFDYYVIVEDVVVIVIEEDFLKVNEELVFSVSVGELRYYEKVREIFEGGRGEEKKDLE